jgi:Cu2+-exporting ATPase
LAVPAAIARAQGRLAARGVLVLGADALRRLADVDAVVFDKTGTLTRGEPVLLDVVLCDADAGASASSSFDADAAKAVAARLEAAVSHPLAKAFGRTDAAAVDAARQHPGEGVSGRIDGVEWRLGRASFALGAADADADREGALWLARDGRAMARFIVDDAPRADAAAAVRALEAEGLALHILSGDAEARVAALAARLGFGDATVRGRLSPSGKLEALRAMQAAGRRVLMVGDGVNDADVLAAADVSIAMAEGAALAQRQADLVLGGPQLMTVVEALRIAREAQSVIRQNLGWAIAYNLAILPAAALGFIGPGLAALGMALSSLAVTANAWRIGRRSTGLAA